MRHNKSILMNIFSILLASSAMGQNLPQGTALPGDNLIPSGTSQKGTQRGKSLPGDQTIPPANAYEVGDPDLKAAIERSKAALEEARSKFGSKGNDASVAPTEGPKVEAAPLPDGPVAGAESLPLPEVEPTPKKRQKSQEKMGTLVDRTAEEPAFTDTKDGVRIFNQALRSAKGAGKDTFTLPSTSVALATTLYGIEATGNVERYVPAELNYAWLGPNGSVVEMKNCRLWLVVRGDYSTERVYGRSQTMSCRAPSGETFDIPIEAHMVDQKEEYLGARGTLVARGKALASAMSFLSDGVKAFGSAMAAAQVNTEVTSTGGFGEPVKGSNVGGDKNKYIVGQTLAGSSAKFLDWWIDYYQSLSPTIAIGPGKKIYLALQRTVQVPKIFFGERLKASEFATLANMVKADEQASSEASHKVNTKHTLTTLQQDSQGEGEVKP